MATITFSNTNLGVLNGLTFNPGLEDVLDPNGIVTFVDDLDPGDPDTFIITNATGGPFNGFKIEIVGPDMNGTGSAGTIAGIRILAPDNTEIATVTGPFNDSSLDNFYDDRLIDPLEGVFAALQNLLGGSDTVTGSSIADHLSNFSGGTDTLIGGGGDDVLRVGYGNFEVHGAAQNGDGGDGETDTLEIVTKNGDYVSATLGLVTDIDALRFVVFDPGAPVTDETEFNVYVDVSQIGAGLLSSSLAVDGSAAASPLSENEIRIRTSTDPTNLTPVNVDLAGWTFTNWNEERSEVSIETNYNAVVNDNIVGTMVGDYINTYAGDDTLRGGAGGDTLYGGLGSDTFVYGANEAGKDEYLSGGDNDDPGIDKVLLLGGNDFTDTNLNDIEQIVFQGASTSSFSQWSLDMWDEQVVTIIGDGNANGLAFILQKDPGYPTAIDLSDLQFQSWTAGSDLVSIRGTNAKDIITGSTQNDVIAGGKGSDDLQGNEGGDAFLFDFALGKGVDHVADFERKEGDIIQLAASIFDELDLGKLKKKAFTTGTEADDKNDRIIYDKDDGVLRYDDDGSGKHDAQIIAVLDNAAQLKAGDLFVV